MTQLLTKIIADFSTTLTTKTAVGATTATLTSGLDGDGIQLPTATYGFTIDRNNTNKEYFTATLTGANLTSIKTVTRGTGVGTSGLTKTHRKGAEVIISDWVAMKRMLDILDGTTSFDSATPLGYDGAPSITTGNQLATKTYVDGVALVSAPKADASTFGVSKLSLTAVDPLIPIVVGDNDGRVPTQAENDAMAGSLGTPSSTNKYVTSQQLTTVTAMSAQAVDGTAGSIFTRTLAGNETFTQSGFTAGRVFMVEVKQGSGTSYTATWFAGITWITSGATAPIQTTVTNGTTTYGFRCTGTNTFLGYLIASQ